MLATLHSSSLTRLTFFSLAAQPVLFYLLRNHTILRSAFFLIYFAFWRGAYDFGFAWVLRKQSEKRWVVRQLKSRGWLDLASGNDWARWWKRELEMKMGPGYKWEDVPGEFNAWLMFRQLVDVVLLKYVGSMALLTTATLSPTRASPGPTFTSPQTTPL
jgi:phosphatidylethanolamine N-methyltransferase